MAENEKYLGLKFDPDAMIRLLGVQLYDTPMAMLRENVQNAYDAILERMHKDPGFNDGCIRIEIIGNRVTVADNGIGMDEQNLQDNYWTAGHSGKNTEDAEKAGVVGHFGIGAMANFGVCSRLEVNTLKWKTTTRFQCIAEKEKLDGQQIALNSVKDYSASYGTIVTAILSEGITFSLDQARDYIKRYVQYIPIPVLINNKPIAQKCLLVDTERSNSKTFEGHHAAFGISFDYKINYLNYQPIKPQILIYNIKLSGSFVKGELYLNTEEHEVFGLNNGFGISHVPLFSTFNLKGIANFSFLRPTAGREAVSQESLKMLQVIYHDVEEFWAHLIAEDPLADGYRDFLVYVSQHFERRLARHIRIRKDAAEDENIALGDVNKEGFAFYRGNDPQIRKSLLSSGTTILFPSQEQPRRRIQVTYLTDLDVEEKMDEVQVTHTYSRDELTSEEFMLLDDIRRTIEDDYIIQNVAVLLADISMGIKVFVKQNQKNSFVIFMERNYDEIRNLLDNQSNYALYLSLIKDFVRVVLYNQFVTYIPRDQKERAVYINEALERRREELTLDFSDVTEIRNALKLLDEGKISNKEFMERSRHFHKGNQEETLNSGQMDHVENIVSTAALAPRVNRSNRHQNAVMEEQFLYVPQPPILEMNVNTDKKILTTEAEIITLHCHRMFIAMSPKFNRDHRSFLLYPHSTKVIWSMHRIIYIFTDQNNKTSLYYEMALTKKLDEKNTGGETLVSTTIITENAIFVPVPKQLYEYFTLSQGAILKFMVHFDKVNG